LCKGEDLYGLLRHDIDKFWEVHRGIQKSEKEVFDENFRGLFEGMVKSKPSDRFSIKKIKETEWYKGSVYTDEELKSVMMQKMMHHEKKMKNLSLTKAQP